MATPQLSPGVLTREVDLTVGRADNVLSNVGAIAGPFTRGPINEATDIVTENDLINVFGKPVSTDAQYEYWMTASSFLSYGGVMKVVRADGATLNNANAAVGFAYTTALKIKNYDDYSQNYSSDSQNWVFAAKNPGSWSNSLKICTIDAKADQTIGITTTNPGTSGVVIGYGVSVGISTAISVAGYTTSFNGYLKGVITGVNTDSSGGASSFDVKIFSRVDGTGGETQVDYKQGAREASFKTADTLVFLNNASNLAGSLTAGTTVDWYDQQQLNLTNSSIYWKSIAPKPGTSSYATQRKGRFDEFHVAVVDDKGLVTGIQGNLIEKFTGLSKATDAISAANSPQRIFWKDFLATNSSYVYGGDNPGVGADTYNNTVPRQTGFSTNFTLNTESQGQWDVPAQGSVYSAIGNVTYTLGGGVDYSAAGGMTAALGDLVTAYGVFSNKEQVKVDYLIMGPGLTDKGESQAKAQYLISVAGDRKDCIATISPHRADVVNITSSTTQTNNIINFFSPLASSSYAVFDSGYKYTYDRFNNQFRYIPCNGDVAGLMVRTGILAYPWFSPAGQQRGILNNAIKLAYNPNKAQRDQLYPLRINSIVNQNGIGILLYGDKTALGYASAFDRINVRKLFLTIEQALQRSANAQLFELNDQITRSNFVNIVEPYLRDIQAKRGLYDFLVVCNETNNTPDVIDNNEFRADIYLKPAKSINYVTLTFVATRTGVSFETVAGTV